MYRIRKKSLPEYGGQGVADIAYSIKMMRLLGLVHALRGKHADRDLLSEEVINDGSGDLVVKGLLSHRVELTLFRMAFYQVLQGLLIDVVVHLAPYHALVQVKPLDVPPFFHSAALEQLLNDAAGLSLLLDERKHKADDVGHDVPVLQLL